MCRAYMLAHVFHPPLLQTWLHNEVLLKTIDELWEKYGPRDHIWPSDSLWPPALVTMKSKHKTYILGGHSCF